MNPSEVEIGVSDLIRKLLSLPEDHAIPVDADFKMDLGIDSLGEAELGMELEDRFGITIPETIRPRNIREVVDMVLSIRAKACAERS